MPVNYMIDSDRNMIRTSCRGNTTLAEVLAHFDELERDPVRPTHADVLLDLTEVTSLPDSNQTRAAANRIGRSTEILRYRACAIVVDREALYGMIRMFEVFSEKHFERTAVFRNRSDADVWLLSRVTERVGRGEVI
jgi:hypothetical protein